MKLSPVVRAVATIVASAALIIGVAACAPAGGLTDSQSVGDPQNGGTMTIGVTGGNSTDVFDPFRYSGLSVPIPSVFEPRLGEALALAPTVTEAIDEIGRVRHAGAERSYAQVMNFDDIDQLDLIAEDIGPNFR